MPTPATYVNPQIEAPTPTAAAAVAASPDHYQPRHSNHNSSRRRHSVQLPNRGSVIKLSGHDQLGLGTQGPAGGSDDGSAELDAGIVLGGQGREECRVWEVEE